MNKITNNQNSICVCGTECQCSPCECSQSQSKLLGCQGCDPCNCNSNCACDNLKKPTIQIKSKGCFCAGNCCKNIRTEIIKESHCCCN